MSDDTNGKDNVVDIHSAPVKTNGAEAGKLQGDPKKLTLTKYIINTKDDSIEIEGFLYITPGYVSFLDENQDILYVTTSENLDFIVRVDLKKTNG